MEKKPSKEIVAMSTTSAKSNKTISNGARVSLKRNAKAKAITTYEENKYSDDQDEEVEYAVPARERATLWAKEVLRQQLGEDVEEDEDKETTQTVNKRLRSDSMVSFASSTNSATVPALGASSIKKSRKNSKMSELLKKETSQMTMGELAMTIPKGRRLIRHEKEEHVSADPFGRSQRLRSLSNDSTRVGFGGEGEAGGTALVAPQVEIIDGKMVIMESTVKYEDTVHYDENDEEAKERDSSNNLHADVERHHRTSASGRSSSSTSTCIPGKRWSKEETKQFYYVSYD
jgi:hypothetical protein